MSLSEYLFPNISLRISLSPIFSSFLSYPRPKAIWGKKIEDFFPPGLMHFLSKSLSINRERDIERDRGKNAFAFRRGSKGLSFKRIISPAKKRLGGLKTSQLFFRSKKAKHPFASKKARAFPFFFFDLLLRRSKTEEAKGCFRFFGTKKQKHPFYSFAKGAKSFLFFQKKAEGDRCFCFFVPKKQLGGL